MSKRSTKSKIFIFFASLAGTVSVLALVFVGTAWTAFGSKPAGESLEAIQQSPQFEGSSFENELTENMGSIPAMASRYAGGENQEPTVEIPVNMITADTFKEPTKLRVVWLGHSTLLVQLGRRVVLIDPVFSERSSPWQFMGPARFHEPPISIEQLPKLDAVVISHDHYDHLDHLSIQKLAEKVPKFFVPLGIKSHLIYWGVPESKIVELDWWERERVGDLEFVSVPARHFSGRSAWDRNRTLWSGWVIKNSKTRVYYSGDTAMFPGFKEIGNKYGPFDLTLIEVGAYDGNWADVHLGPEQAVQANLDVGGQHMIGVHWGTFNLAVHGWTEPMERLKIAADKAGVIVSAPQVGEVIDMSAPPEWSRWWPELPFETAEESPIVSSGL